MFGKEMLPKLMRYRYFSARGIQMEPFTGCRDIDITEIAITESDVTENDITENDITESDITESDIT